MQIMGRKGGLASVKQERIPRGYRIATRSSRSWGLGWSAVRKTTRVFALGIDELSFCCRVAWN
jgi:hypothetical protein